MAYTGRIRGSFVKLNHAPLSTLITGRAALFVICVFLCIIRTDGQDCEYKVWSSKVMYNRFLFIIEVWITHFSSFFTMPFILIPQAHRENLERQTSVQVDFQSWQRDRRQARRCAERHIENTRKVLDSPNYTLRQILAEHCMSLLPSP